MDFVAMLIAALERLLSLLSVHYSRKQVLLAEQHAPAGASPQLGSTSGRTSHGRQIKSRGKAVAVPAGHRCFIFEGADSLSIARFAGLLASHPDCHTAVMAVSGRSNRGRGQCAVMGTCAGGVVDGYERRIGMQAESKDISVGGDNATSEDIAAQVVAFHLSEQLYEDLIVNTSAAFHSVDSRTKLKISDLEQRHRYGEVNSAIEIAKHLGNREAVDLLIEYLKRSSFGPPITDLVCDAFRSFGTLYSRDMNTARRVAFALKNFIASNRHVVERSCSLVYAIESLGYAGKYDPAFAPALSQFLIDFLRDDGNRLLHRDTVWATAVAVARLPIAYSEKVATLERICGEMKGCHGSEYTAKLIEDMRRRSSRR
ncbi:MAG: hypothetical protein WD894_07130 [Pirellulales bacterium]